MIYDVTLPIAPGMVVWPGDAPVSCVLKEGRVNTSQWTLGSHTGTHVDAQTHFSAGPGTVDGLPLDVLIGRCRLIDVGDVDTVTHKMLAEYQLAGTVRLLIRTRNSTRWVSDQVTFDPEQVALDTGAAEHLVELGIKLVGIDGLSVAPAGRGNNVHTALLEPAVIIIEGLNLAGVPEGEYDLICAPLKLQGCDGAPARVFLID
jgi:arylformamidase